MRKIKAFLRLVIIRHKQAKRKRLAKAMEDEARRRIRLEETEWGVYMVCIDGVPCETDDRYYEPYSLKELRTQFIEIRERELKIKNQL